MFGLWMNEECRSRLEEFTGQQWKSIEEFGSWQGRKPNGEEHRTNMVKVFVWWCKDLKGVFENM